MEDVLGERPPRVMMNRKVITAAKILLTMAFLGYVVSLISFSEMERSLSQINLWYLIYLMFLFLLFILIGAFNTYVIILSIRAMPFSHVLKIFTIGVSVGMFTPAYVGEFGSVTFLLKEKGLTLSEGLSVPSIDKFITIIVASFLCLMGLWIYFPGTGIFVYIGLCFVLISSLAILLIRPLRRYIKAEVIEPFFPWSLRFLHAFVSFFLNHRYLVLLNLLGTFFRAFLGAFMIWLGLYALGVQRGVLDVAFISFVARMVGYIPVTINGLGLLEGAAISAFAKMHIQPEPILLALLIDRSIAIFFGLVVILLFSGKKGMWFLKRSSPT